VTASRLRQLAHRAIWGLKLQDALFRLREVATRFWLFTFVGMVLFGIIYYRHAQNELSAQRNQLSARQRAVAAAAGQAGFALRDKLEAWVLQLATATPSGRVPLT